jgi:ClpP class serine protease
VNDVAQSRSLDPALHTVWANGKTMTGNQALVLNLVDDLGSWSDALAAIKELAKIEGKMKLVQAKRKKSLVNLFMQGDDEESNRGFLSSSLGQFLSNAVSSFYAHQSQTRAL